MDTHLLDNLIIKDKEANDIYKNFKLTDDSRKCFLDSLKLRLRRLDEYKVIYSTYMDKTIIKILQNRYWQNEGNYAKVKDILDEAESGSLVLTQDQSNKVVSMASELKNEMNKFNKWYIEELKDKPEQEEEE